MRPSFSSKALYLAIADIGAFLGSKKSVSFFGQDGN